MVLKERLGKTVYKSIRRAYSHPLNGILGYYRISSPPPCASVGIIGVKKDLFLILKEKKKETLPADVALEPEFLETDAKASFRVCT